MQVVVTLGERGGSWEGTRAGWGAGGSGAKLARLTSSPQSVPQLFLMAQKGTSEPGKQRGVQGVRALSTLHSFKYMLWAYCVTGTRKRAEKTTGPPTTLL